jgi:hypothetical protein
MDRVYKSGAIGTPPVHTENTSSGFPTSSNPGAGVPATKVGPYWVHMITEELRNVIVAAGLTPDKATLTQLQAAIAAQIAAAVTGVLVINRDVTQLEVVNTTTETVAYTFTVPGGTLGSTKALRLSLIGDHLNNDGATRTLTIRVKFGGTTILTAAFDVTADAPRLAFIGEVVLSAANNVSAQVAKGEFIFGDQGTTGGTMDDSGYTQSYGINNAVAENSAINRDLQITIQHQVASANVSFRLHTAQLELFS